MAPLATFAQKFGKVNTQTIMQALPDIAKVNGELQAQQKTYENDLKGMQDAKGAGASDSLPKDSADLPGQLTGSAKEAARTHAAYRDKGAQCH